MSPPVHGLLLTNLGTPDAPTPRAVRRYLAEFLSDPHVLDMNPVARWLLLHGLILRTRPAKSAHAYRLIWTPRGSPLLTHLEDLAAALGPALGPTWRVAAAMRYGNPSLASALASLTAPTAPPLASLTVLPLYPQFATSSTQSTLEATRRLIASHQARGLLPADLPIREVRDFFADPGFIAAQAALARDALTAFRPDKILMSFHGLPERHLTRLDPHHHTPAARCLARPDCCASLDAANASCYRAQAHATARALAAALDLAPDAFEVAFQSRLGRTPWIQPYTDVRLAALPQEGVRRVAVFSPSFTADCLETLEEIHLRGRDTFLQAGGEAFLALPCVNADPRWVAALVALATRESPTPTSTPSSAPTHLKTSRPEAAR